MTIDNLSSASGVAWGSGQTDAVSGASSHVQSSSADSALTQMRSEIQQNSQNFGGLTTALNANDLSGANQAYAAVQQIIQNASSAAGGKSPFDPNSPIGNDFQTVGTALQAGDLSGAKQAFTAFRTDIMIAGRNARAQTPEAAGANEPEAAPTNPGNPGSIVGGTLNTIA